MTISNSNIYSESHSILKSFIKDNITDPRSRYKKQWIHASMPNINDKGFSGYPFIIISVDVSEESKSFDRDTSNKVFRISLNVRSDEATEVDSICDDIFSKLKDESYLTDFEAREVSSSPFNYVLDEKGKKIVYRIIGAIFRRRQ